MDLNLFIKEKKTIIIEVLLLVAVVVGCYFGYTYFFKQQESDVSVEINPAILGKNFVTFLNASRSGAIDLKDQQFLRSTYVSKLKDYSEVILPAPKRGRMDPFVPYAATRPLH
jgi:hypothetical protein